MAAGRSSSPETLVIPEPWTDELAARSAAGCRPILLGEAPSKSGDRYNRFPISGRVSETLCRLASIEPEPDGSRYGRWYWALREVFSVGNVISRYAAAYPWSLPRAQAAWTRWLVGEWGGREPLVVVCLGRRVQRAVGLGAARGWGDWVFAGLLAAVAIPHPSGLNRVLNDPGVRLLVGETLDQARRIAVHGHPDWRI